MLLIFGCLMLASFVGCGKDQSDKSAGKGKAEGVKEERETTIDKVLEDTKAILRQIDPSLLDVGQRLSEIESWESARRETIINQTDSIDKSINEAVSLLFEYSRMHQIPTETIEVFKEINPILKNIEESLKDFQVRLYSLTYIGRVSKTKGQLYDDEGTLRRQQLIDSKGMPDEFDKAVIQCKEIQAEIKKLLDKSAKPGKELTEFYSQLQEFVSQSEEVSKGAGLIEQEIDDKMKVIKDKTREAREKISPGDEKSATKQAFIELDVFIWNHNPFPEGLRLKSGVGFRGEYKETSKEEFDKAKEWVQELLTETKPTEDQELMKIAGDFLPIIKKAEKISSDFVTQHNTIEKAINASEIIKDVISKIHLPFENLNETQVIFGKLIKVFDKLSDYAQLSESLEKLSKELGPNKNKWTKIWDDLITLSNIGNKVFKLTSPAIKSLFEPKEGLTCISGITHKVEGNEYWIDNKIVSIPHKYEDLFVDPATRGGSPNQRTINGWFKFIKNTTGRNAFDGIINVELYDVDLEWAENYSNAKSKYEKYKSLLQGLRHLGENDLISANNIGQFIEAMKLLVDASK